MTGTHAVAVVGITGHLVRVEASIGDGPPGLTAACLTQYRGTVMFLPPYGVLSQIIRLTRQRIVVRRRSRRLDPVPAGCGRDSADSGHGSAT